MKLSSRLPGSKRTRYDVIAEHDDLSLILLQKRLLFAALVILLFFTAITLRLWHLQVTNGEEYRNNANKNRVRIRKTAPPRGHILDRFGREIVSNRPSFNVTLVKEDSKDITQTLKKLAPILGMTEAELWEKVRLSSGNPHYYPIVLKEDIDWKTLAYLKYHNRQFAGVRTEVQPVRVYPYTDLAANIIGYLGSITKKELKESTEKDIYQGGDLIGKRGLEKLREKDLRGEKGERLSEVDAKGFEQRMLKEVEPMPGRDIQLTIDIDLQRVAENFMAAGEKSGAVVVLEVNTGKVLAAVSAPSIHITDFVGGISSKKWQALLANPRKPLLNKVVQGSYPPGSIYKMITALAGLSKGVINENTQIFCPGYYRFGNRIYRCWKHSGHGKVNLKQAIAQSCDVYFYQVGQTVGVDVLADFARKLGLGAKTGIEMAYEKSGLTPTKEWKQRVKKRRWQDGETLSVAIGQGFNLVTPLQIAQMTAAIANGGTVYRPQIVEKVIAPGGEVIENFQPQIVRKITGRDSFFHLIQQGMTEVVEGRRGTARKVRIKGIPIAGKTGTAQVVKVAQYRGLKDEDIPYNYRDHGWFTCYAPANKPQIAVAVLVEHGLHGNSSAGPVARAVLQQYFADQIKQNELSNN